MGKQKLKNLFKPAIMALLLAAVFLISWNVSAAETETITFSGNGITGSGSGYETDGTALTIKSAGTYIITGSCTEGSIEVAKELSNVTLILRDLTLSSSETAPIVIKKGSNVTIQLSGSNKLSDLEDASTEDTNDDFEGAGIKVKSGSTLTINGSGTLTIDASSCKNGIKGAAESTVNIESGTIIINSANHAIACDGTLRLSGGTFRLTSQNEGIKASPDDDDTTSAGIINISGGSYTINAADDAIHGDNGVTITGGTFEITAGDDAIHSDYTTTIGTSGSSSGPAITVKSCYEGIEGAIVNLYSGSCTLKAGDDGVNAANSDLGNYAFAINISGGTWLIDADGDGIDSNKDVNISGGRTEVFGSTNGGNSALDYDGSCTLTGGSIIAVGNTGMAQSVSSGLSLNFSNVNVSSGTGIVIKDASGNIIYSTTGKKSANSIIFASSELVSGSSYTLYLNGNSAGTATAAQNAGGMGGRPGQNNGQQGNFDPANGGQQGDFDPANGGQRPDPNAENGGQRPDPNAQNSGQNVPPTPPAEGSAQDSGMVLSFSNEWVNGQWYAKNGSSYYSYKGSWKHNSRGWWYQDESGWYPKSQWQKIDGRWYYFNAQGYMESSCYRNGYWLDRSGAWNEKYSGGAWHKNSKGWWYQDNTGWYPTSTWLMIDGKWYYFKSDGYLAVNTVVDGYKVGADGAWVN